MRIRILGLAALLAASPLAAADSPELPGWMEGAWEQAGPGALWADEYWNPPRDGIIVGAARIGAGDALGVFEHTRIVRTDDGTLAFFKQPLGRTAADFPMEPVVATMSDVDEKRNT